MNKADLLEKMSAGREKLEVALASVDQGDMTTPTLANGWSVKDLLAHLAFWEARIANTYGKLARGEVPHPGLDEMGEDELNAIVYAENKHRPLEVVRREESEAFGQLESLVQRAPEADLFDPNRFRWTEGERFMEWIAGNTYAHYEAHLPDLLAWIERSGDAKQGNDATHA